jgi:hypothetical protein
MDIGLRDILFIAIEEQGFVYSARLGLATRTQDPLKKIHFLSSLTIGSKDILIRLDLYKRYSFAKLMSISRNTVRSSLLFLHSQAKTIETGYAATQSA